MLPRRCLPSASQPPSAEGSIASASASSLGLGSAKGEGAFGGHSTGGVIVKPSGMLRKLPLLLCGP